MVFGWPVLISALQIVSGLSWVVPLVLYAPAVWRIWRSPRHGPSRPDPIDVLVSPLAFVAALQIGFVIRWILFPQAIVSMAGDELIVWSGLYSLSIVAAFASVRAWSISRGLHGG